VFSDEVAFRWLVKPGDERDRVVEQRHQRRKRVAEEARDAQRDVDSRPAELVESDRLQAGDPPRLLMPYRPDAEQRQDLAGIVAVPQTTIPTDSGYVPWPAS
jgi:hypothetical protein